MCGVSEQRIMYNVGRSSRAVVPPLVRVNPGYVYSINRTLHNPMSVKGTASGLPTAQGWECSLAALSQTTTHMHGNHEATIRLAGVTLGRELRLESSSSED